MTVSVNSSSAPGLPGEAAKSSLLRRARQRMFRERAEDSLPLTMEHQRIYILPTRRGLAFLLALLVMLIASVNYALSLGYALCFLLTGLFAATLLHTYRNVAGTTVDSISAANCFAGEQLCFTVVLSNSDARERYGVTVKSAAGSANGDITSPHPVVLRIEQLANQRGRIAPGRLTITSNWPLGLWRSWCYVHSRVDALVYPRAESPAPALPANPQDANGEQSRLQQQGDVSGIRDYVSGDSPAIIAWKQAARGTGLYSKTFDEDSVGGETRLSFESTGLVEQEEQLSRLCAWALAADSLQGDYSLQLPGVSIAAGNGQQHREQVLATLALFGQP